MASFISDQDLRRLTSGRWLIQILASMSAEPESRFGALARGLGVSRSVLSASLGALERFGWIARNPGHGHPLRPEYVLTPSGRPVAAWCARVVNQQTAFGVGRRALGRWSLPLLFGLAPAPQRFAPLQRLLAPVTPRALSLTLHDMRGLDLVGHDSANLLYRLTARGRDFTLPLLPPGSSRRAIQVQAGTSG